MEDYRLEQSGQEVQDILNGAAMQTDLTAENDRAELAERTLQGNIDGEALARETADGVLQGHINDEETRAKAAEKQNADDIDAIEEKIPSGASSQNKLATAGELAAKQDALTFDNAPTPSSTNPVTSGGVHTAIDNEKGARINADAALQQSIEAILVLIPSAATALNQLADKSFVNSTVATASATFRGTYNLVSDLSLAVTATHAQIAAALAGAVSGADNNDYAFVQIPTSADTPTEIRVTERYKFNGEIWAYEYDLNNSGFTAAQWEAINSAITSALVTKLSALPTASELTTLFAGKQNTLTFDNAPVSGSSNPVKSGGIYDAIAAITAVIPSAATSSNKLVDLNALTAYVTGIIGALDASFDLTSTDGHVTLKMTQVDGVITTLQILTSDIASAQALTTLSGQVSTNADDIAALQALYNALQQSAPQVIEPADTWPVASPSDTVIYRVIDRVNTPPQYYSDYMWNGTTMVLMATYNNAIDPLPKKDSQNLVTSGGVFNNMGALDVSELNATENPHHLAQYVDLSAALAAVPTDYQKGGMSIKFVQSSDNKYVQFRCIADEFTTDITQWAINEEGVYVENPEWMYVITDKEKRIVGGIKQDGSIEWTKGVPSPVKNYVIQYIGQYIKEEEIPHLLEVGIDAKGNTLYEISDSGAEKVYLQMLYKNKVGYEGKIELSESSANSLQESMSDNITSINSLNPRSYFYPRIANMNMRKKDGGTAKPLVLCHFSDIHGSENYSRVMEFMHIYKERHLCDDILLTGDMVSAKFDDSIDFMSTEPEDKCLLVIGNHDAWETNTLPIVVVPQKDTYDKFFSPYISGWGVVQPENAASLGKCYYYKDYPNSKIRAIVTDCMHDSEDQVSFVESALEGARQLDYSVLMVQHYPSEGIVKVDSPFQSVDYSGSVMENNDAYADSVQTFMNNGGKFICWITGHTHVDTFGYCNTHPDQLQIGIDTAAAIRAIDTLRIDGTKTQDCFNVYSIDTDMGILTMLRVGADTDRHCRQKNVFVWDYINKEEII